MYNRLGSEAIHQLTYQYIFPYDVIGNIGDC